MNNLRASDPLFATPLESVVRRFLSSSLYDSELVTLRMPVDIQERDGIYAFQADLPGLKKEDINVRIDGNQVQIEVRDKQGQGASTTAAGTGTGTAVTQKVLRTERNHGAICRTFSMADDIDDSQVKASYVDGVLQLELPKKASSPAKRISIQ